MKIIKAFVLSFVVLAGVSAYAATGTKGRAKAGAQGGSACCVSSCCAVGAACCPVPAGQE
jgi:hypothetical protein